MTKKNLLNNTKSFNKQAISVNRCIDRLISQANLLVNTEVVNLIKAKNRVLSTDIQSLVNVPPADNSAMDGYAINSKDYIEGKSFVISQRVQAGDSNEPLTNNTAARIFTGAEIPQGADSVIIQENAAEMFELVNFRKPPQHNGNIRKRGQDISSGETIIKAGTRLRPQEIGLLASVGINKINVYKPLKIGVLTTGNELIEPGNKLSKGKIYNSNRFLIDSLLSDWGYTTNHAKTARDTLAETTKKLEKLAETSDIILSTGGVSVGEEDHIKNAVNQLGALSISKVAIKPGKPFAFGDIKGKPFIGLPGNPVSAYVTLLMLARPFLFASQGRKESDLKPSAIKMRTNIIRHLVSREEYLRCRLNDQGLYIYPKQSSGVLSAASWGNCLLKHPAGKDINPKTMLEVYMYRDLHY